MSIKAMFHSDALFFYAIFHERRDKKLDYVIKNNKNVYIRINNNGSPVPCSKNDRTLFEYSKAKNILNCLPKTMKKMRFVVEAVPEIQNQKAVGDTSAAFSVFSSARHGADCHAGVSCAF